MPMYDYKCDKCDREWEAVHFIAERGNEKCCGEYARRLISKSQSRPVIMEYYSESLGKRITGPQQKARLLREMNMSEAG